MRTKHNSRNIEPHMILDETDSKELANPKQTKEQNFNRLNQDKISDQIANKDENKALIKSSSKAKKGKWIVRLERLEITNLNDEHRLN